MPAIAEKVDALQGQVFRYDGLEGWYYREWDKSSRKYRVKKIPDANTLVEAVANCYKALLLLNGTDAKPAVRKPREKKIGIEDEIEAWLTHSEQRVDAGLKDERAHIRRCVVLRKHLIQYLRMKNISDVKEITEATFEDYPIWRKEVAKATRKTELKEIQTFLRHWLAKQKKIDPNIIDLPRIAINPEDLDANPALSPHDYEVINKYIRKVWIPAATNKRSRYFRQMFWTFVHVLKNSGMRVGELLAVEFRDITITNQPRYSVSWEKEVNEYYATILVRKSKTGKPRDVICRSNAGDRIYKFRLYQKDWFARYLPSVSITPNTLVFGSPEQLMEKTYSHRYMDQCWRDIVGRCKDQLEGNRFSDREYTLYSLRSTFIENCILDDINIYTVATLCGNSVKTIQRYYDRHDVLKKAPEIQHIERGRRKDTTPEKIDLI
jgi:integrase